MKYANRRGARSSRHGRNGRSVSTIKARVITGENVGSSGVIMDMNRSTLANTGEQLQILAEHFHIIPNRGGPHETLSAVGNTGIIYRLIKKI